MAKKKGNSIVYKCNSCGFTQPRWLGRCPECGEWNSFEEWVQESASSVAGNSSSTLRAKPTALSAVNAQEGVRLSTGIEEFDRVLGGGAMLRSAILLGGEPGIGKSTLLLQTAASISQRVPSTTQGSIAGNKRKILYVSGEESAPQIKARAQRLGITEPEQMENLQLLCTTQLADIEDALNDTLIYRGRFHSNDLQSGSRSYSRYNKSVKILF